MLREPRLSILQHCRPSASNGRQRILERDPRLTLTVLCAADGEPQLASTVIDTIMAGLPGPRGAPGPVGPPGDSRGWLQGWHPGQGGHSSVMERGWCLQGRELIPTARALVARSNCGFIFLSDCFTLGRTHLEKLD